jgi:hypothetical protein
MRETTQLSSNTGGTNLSPFEGPCPAESTIELIRGLPHKQTELQTGIAVVAGAWRS